MTDNPKCECGHTKSWHRRKKGDTQCMKRECYCARFVEKPVVEVEWEP